MIADANEILGNKVDQNATKKQNLIFNKGDVDRKLQKKSELSIKRPNGMHRELFNLLVHQGKDGNKLHTIMPTNTKKGYSSVKAKLGLRRARKWFWQSFNNPGRKDNLQLSHWEREGESSIKEYPFAKLNKVVEPVTFTDTEYDEYLEDMKWSKLETKHLLQLCHRFDLRWPIIEDRFDKNLSINKKCMEDLKERYYSLINLIRSARANAFLASDEQTMVNNGTGAEQPYFGFDAEHEKRRKEQLKKLWERTEEQVKEEEELKAALKRIETKRKEREKKAYDLQRLINATDRTSLSPDSSAVSSGSSANRANRKLKIKTAQAAAVQLISPSDTLAIRYHEFRSSGPHLRTQEMKMPSNIGQKKQKNIETVIDKLKLDVIPHGMEEVVDLYNNFRSNIVVLQDLKTALHSAEIELDILNARMKSEKNATIKIEPRMRVSELNLELGGELMSPSRSKGKIPGTSTSSRRITSWIDVNPAGFSTSRKRKVRQFSPSEASAAAIRSRP